MLGAVREEGGAHVLGPIGDRLRPEPWRDRGRARRLAREHGAARNVVSPEGENNPWTLVRLDDLGDLYIRLLEGEAPGGTPLLAVSDGSHRAWEIAEVASRAGGADGRVEARRLDEALEKLGDHAYALALDHSLTSERVRRDLGLDALDSLGIG